MTTESATVTDVWTLLESLPDDVTSAPPSDLMRYILARRSEFEMPAIEMLAKGVEGQHVPTRGYRAVYLISLLGEWRSEAAVPVLVQHLHTPWGYGWDEIPHASARIGSAAILPMLSVSITRQVSPLWRRRAMRSLAAIAFDSRNEVESPREEERRKHWNLVTAAFDYIISSGDRERAEVIDEAAARLCDLCHVRSWERIESMFRSGALKERDGFNLAVAGDLMHGRLAPFSFGGRDQSMVEWMMRKP